MSERPFRVLGVQQIAVGHRDAAELERLWLELFGLEVVGRYRSDTENVDEAITRVGKGAGAVEIDLMTPLDETRTPRVHEPALNHIGLWVDDLNAAYTWLRARGVRFAGSIRPGAAGHPIAFIHPKASTEFPLAGAGVLIELVQAPPEIIAALG